MRRRLTEDDSSLPVELLANAVYFDDKYLVDKAKALFSSSNDVVSNRDQVVDHMVNVMDVSREESDSKFDAFINKYYKEVK